MAPSNDYMKQWRDTPAGKAAIANQQMRDRAKRRALTRLISLHPTDWERIFQQELDREKASRE